MNLQDFDATAIEEVAHLFPPMAQTLIRLIGLRKTLYLISQRGGTAWFVAKGQNRTGEANVAALADWVGQDGAAAIVAHFGGDVLHIPQCKTAARELMHRLIRQEFDQITQQQHLPACHAVTELAIKYHLDARTIYRITKRIDSPSPQLSLI